MSYNDNSTVFYYEICSLWQSQKNLQCFFIFGNDPSETYYKVPNLSFKIKTKTDYDNTEVKLYLAFSELPQMLDVMKEYLNNKETQMINLAGQKYSFHIGACGGEAAKTHSYIRIIDGNNNSNDYSLSNPTLKHIIKTLDHALNNIVKLSLDFVKIAQNNDIIKHMKSLNDKFFELSSKINQPQPSRQQGDVWYGETTTIGTPIVNYQSALSNAPIEETISPAIDACIDPLTDDQKSVLDGELPPPPPIVDLTAAAEKQPIEENSNKSDTPNINQTKIENLIEKTLKEPPEITIIHIITDAIKDAYDKKISTYNIIKTIFNNAMSLGIDLSFEKMSSYFYTTHGSFETYFQKLALITDMFKGVSTKVPLFFLLCKQTTKYFKESKIINDGFLKIYLALRDNEKKTDFEEYEYACLRFLLAPLWSSYLYSSEEATNGNQFLNLLRQLTFKLAQTWKQDYVNIIDTFIYDNKLVLNFREGVVEEIFHTQCPTLFDCLSYTPDENSDINDFFMVKDIINQLIITKAYEEINIEERWDLSKLSETFLKLVLSFPKANTMKGDLKLNQVKKYYENEMSKFSYQECLDMFKALKAVDTNKDILSKVDDKVVVTKEKTGIDLEAIKETQKETDRKVVDVSEFLKKQKVENKEKDAKDKEKAKNKKTKSKKEKTSNLTVSDKNPLPNTNKIIEDQKVVDANSTFDSTDLLNM